MPELIATVAMPDVHCVECGEGLELDWGDKHPESGATFHKCPVCGTVVEIVTRTRVDYTIWRTNKVLDN